MHFLHAQNQTKARPNMETITSLQKSIPTQPNSRRSNRTKLYITRSKSLFLNITLYSFWYCGNGILVTTKKRHPSVVFFPGLWNRDFTFKWFRFNWLNFWNYWNPKVRLECFQYLSMLCNFVEHFSSGKYSFKNQICFLYLRLIISFAKVKREIT